MSIEHGKSFSLANRTVFRLLHIILQAFNVWASSGGKMILNAASDSKDVWSELFYYFCTPYNNWKLKTTFLWLCGCKIIHFASHLQQLQLFSSYLIQWWSNKTGFWLLTGYLSYSWYKARKSYFCVIAIVQLALKILFYHVLKSFFVSSAAFCGWK